MRFQGILKLSWGKIEGVSGRGTKWWNEKREWINLGNPPVPENPPYTHTHTWVGLRETPKFPLNALVWDAFQLSFYACGAHIDSHLLKTLPVACFFDSFFKIPHAARFGMFSKFSIGDPKFPPWTVFRVFFPKIYPCGALLHWIFQKISPAARFHMFLKSPTEHFFFTSHF